MLDINYIDDDISKGILVDWKKVKKEFKKLNIPNFVHSPINYNFNKNTYFIELSERSVGKTTNWLLLGIILFKMYGITICYVRQNDMMIAPKNIKRLFDTIIEYDYISKIFNGEYNNIKYDKQKWYIVNVDDTGNVEKIINNPFMQNLCINKQEMYKSTFNNPKADLIIFDEFISKTYLPNEFTEFMQLVKTIQRERESVKIVCLANTIDIYNQYLHEFCIFDEVQKMPVGYEKELTTEYGTNIHIALISPNKNLSAKKKKSNFLYYGFKNEKLNSIRGGGWDMPTVQHIPDIESDIVINNIYIKHNNKLLKLDVVLNKYGFCVYCHWASHTYKDSVIYTLEDCIDVRFRFGFGNDFLSKKILKIIEENKIFFALNDCKAFLDNYLKLCN